MRLWVNKDAGSGAANTAVGSAIEPQQRRVRDRRRRRQRIRRRRIRRQLRLLRDQRRRRLRRQWRRRQRQGQVWWQLSQLCGM
jgi:hypothetical protein